MYEFAVSRAYQALEEATDCKHPLLLFWPESLSVDVPLLWGVWLLQGPQERIWSISNGFLEKPDFVSGEHARLEPESEVLALSLCIASCGCM